MAGTKQLNVDILTQIVKYIDIDNVEVTCKCLLPTISTEEMDSITSHRQNPMLLLKQLVDDPEPLLIAMGLTGTLLSGSRATEYFYPGIISEKSDWDFYCFEDPIVVDSFGSFLETMGVRWIYRSDINEDRDVDTDNKYYGHNTIVGKINTNNTIQTIQLIIQPKKRCSVFDIIVKFHSSIVQCFISAFGAVCMYKNLTMRGRSIAWNSRIESEEDERDSKLARSKYISRGIKYTSYEWYSCVDQDIDDHYISTSIIDLRRRKIGDRNSKVISFISYYSEEVSELNIVFDKRNNSLSPFENLEWLESPYRCSSLTCTNNLRIPDKLSLLHLAKLYNLYPKLSILLRLQKAGRMMPDDPLHLQNMMQIFSNLDIRF